MKTLADIFLDILSQFQDKETKIMANRMKYAIKNKDVLNLVNLAIENTLGQKTKIKLIQVDNAIEAIIAIRHSEIDKQELSDIDKELQKTLYKCFAIELAKIIKRHLYLTGQLEQ